MSPRSFLGQPPEVLIMAGGQGRRLGSLTSLTPKPMLPVGGRPALQHTLEHLRAQGVGHVFLSVRHLAHVISDYFGDGGWLDLDIDYVVENRPLGTAGAISLLPEQSKPLLVMNGDVLTPVPVADLAAHHHAHGAAMTVGYVKQRMPIPYGVIQCTGGLEVLGLREKPEIVLTVIAGVYVIAPEVVDGTALDVPLAMPDLIETVLGSGRVVGFPLPGPWLDIGTPETYARADQVAAFTGRATALTAHLYGLHRRGRPVMTTLVAGLGPAGRGVLTAMLVAGILPAVCDDGLVVVDPSSHPVVVPCSTTPPVRTPRRSSSPSASRPFGMHRTSGTPTRSRRSSPCPTARAWLSPPLVGS